MLEERIRSLVEDTIKEDDGLFLVDVKIKGNSGNQKVLIFVDGDDGISIDMCGKISRSVGNVIEEEELIEGKYILEVSSPGLDFPLTLHRQYVKNIGRELDVELEDGECLSGELIEVTNNTITLQMKEIREIPVKDIKQSKVKISFK